MINGAAGCDALIKQSVLFSAKWYLDRYPDVAGAGIEPLRHY